MSEPEIENTAVIQEAQLERLRAIFDPERKLETDEDLLEIAKLVEDESDEKDLGK
ncbi:MAG: hypothetical protein R2682_01895 [Pyrinomonadaceae bacterium]